MQLMQLTEIKADLHVHIGWIAERAIKVPASRDLTVEEILKQARAEGIQLLSLVDGLSPLVRAKFKQLRDAGLLLPLPEGGLLWENAVVVIPAAEVETVDFVSATERNRRGTVYTHILVYFPDLESLNLFAESWQREMDNSRRHLLAAASLANDLGGLVVPAHVFTPHKGLFAAPTEVWERVLESAPGQAIKAIELGLSADSRLADRLSFNANFQYFSNSDAHSIRRLGREFTNLMLQRPSFRELQQLLWGRAGRRISTNYGLYPELGKYYRSFCPACRRICSEMPPILLCPKCGNDRIIRGVCDRIELLARSYPAGHIKQRPEYHYNIPLEYLPGFGPKTIRRLLESFGTEHVILHRIPLEQIAAVAGDRKAAYIAAARVGRLTFSSGGGGIYGKVSGWQ